MVQVQVTVLITVLLEAVVLTYAQNIDILEPIMRRPPSSDNDEFAFFGYKTTLHRFQESPNDFSSYLQSTRIIVSAPNGTAANAPNAEPHTGLIYTCTVMQATNNGECEPLRGDMSGADRRLYDTEANEQNELKRAQFLGVDMDSRNGNFIVCGHRYINIDGTRFSPFGRCFFTNNRNLQGFQEYQPCDGLSRNFASFGICQAGTSATFAAEGSNGNLAFGLGAPGSNFWLGAVFRRGSGGANDRRIVSSSNTAFYSWQGYTMTKGHIQSTTREDFIVSLPRSRNYFGQVNVVQNDEDLTEISQNLQGRQMGEYFGFSLVAASLTQTQYDDVLVGAPMYTSPSRPERGRVYLFRNTNGVLSSDPIILNGPSEPYVRFGHAMANLGDINSDGFEDVAISAPFGDGPGFVYIYHGSPTEILSPMPAQVINGSEVLGNILNNGVTNMKAFGYSLSSGLDVDGNGYFDLVIGSYEAQRIFLLRTRPVARMMLQISAMPTVVDVMGTQTPRCMHSGSEFACFNVSICGNYDGLGVSDSLETSYVITGDRNMIPQRIFFAENDMHLKTETMKTFFKNQMTCFIETFLVRENIVDVFNGFTIDVELSGPSFNPTMQNGNPANPTNLRAFPTLEIAGNTEVFVDTLKDCDGICIPNLAVNLVNITYETQTGERVNNLVAGLVTFINVWLNVRNIGDDAYLTQLAFNEPTQQLTFTRIEPRNLLITCSRDMVSSEITRRSCPISNPLQGGQTRLIAIRLQPSTSITGSEGQISLTFNASSINSELNTTLADNTLSVPITVTARADIHLDQAIATPELLTYSNMTPPANLSNVTQLGAQTQLTFVVVNEGPTTIPNARLSIFWPYRPTADSNFTLLYPATITTSNQVRCTMANRFINPESYPITSVGGEGEDTGITGPGGEGKRRKRSVSQRQVVENNAPPGAVVVMARNITINCQSNPDQCVEFECDVRQLQGPGSAQVTVTAYLDGRYFADKIDRFTFNAYANITIIDSSYIEQPAANNNLPDETTVQVRAITIALTPGEGRVEPWVIIVPIILGLLALAVLAVILYVVGFFKRKSKQRKDELQAQFLADQQGGEVPPDGATEAAT